MGSTERSWASMYGLENQMQQGQSSNSLLASMAGLQNIYNSPLVYPTQEPYNTGGMAGIAGKAGGYGSMTQAQMHQPWCFGIHEKDGTCSRPKTKEKSMLDEFKNDMKQFMREHKGLIYTIVGLWLADHFLFQGKFKAKLTEIVHKIVGNVEAKVDKLVSHEPKQ